MFGLLPRKKQGPGRGHVIVHVDKASGAVLDTEVVQALLADELPVVLDAMLKALNPLSEAARREAVLEMQKRGAKAASVMDKLARRAAKWETQAKAVVPREQFVGEAAEGFVSVTVDGLLNVHHVEVHDGARPESAFALAKDALDDATQRVAARWEDCLKGALDTDTDASGEGPPLLAAPTADPGGAMVDSAPSGADDVSSD